MGECDMCGGPVDCPSIQPDKGLRTGYACSRDAGHEGQHVACVGYGHKVAVWDDPVTTKTFADIDFRNHSRGEVIEIIQAMMKPQYEPLIRWLKQSLEFEKALYAVRVEIANAERAVEDVR
jgi:hypothetical protein